VCGIWREMPSLLGIRRIYEGENGRRCDIDFEKTKKLLSRSEAGCEMCGMIAAEP
jgi:hypothetical protein